MTNTCKIRIIDEVNAVFVGLKPEHVGYLKDKHSEYAANYRFNPKFELGVWDGKINFFSPTAKTYVQLVDKIVPQLIKWKYKITVEDLRLPVVVEPDFIDKDFFSHIIEPEEDKPWEVRDYQVNFVNALIEAGGGTGIAGTGAGKSSCAAALSLSYERAGGLRSIVIVPDKNLVEQTRAEYLFFGLDTGEYSGDNKDLDHQHVVSTWQALQNNPMIMNSFDMVIVDECHLTRGVVLQKLLNQYGKNIQYRFGVTGTLPEEPVDKMTVLMTLGQVKFEIPAHQLIDEGYLAKLHIDIMQTDINLKSMYSEFQHDNPNNSLTYVKFKNMYFPDFQSEKNFLQTNESRLDWIVDFLKLKRSGVKGNTLCLVNNIAFGNKLAKRIDGAIFLQGKDKMKVRKQIYESFKEKDNLLVIATVQIASTGLNIKRIFNMVTVDIGKSFTRVIQTIGRGLRKAHDKDSVLMSDICADLKYSKRHLTKRVKFYNDSKYPFTKHKVIVDQ